MFPQYSSEVFEVLRCLEECHAIPDEIRPYLAIAERDGLVRLEEDEMAQPYLPGAVFYEITELGKAALLEQKKPVACTGEAIAAIRAESQSELIVPEAATSQPSTPLVDDPYLPGESPSTIAKRWFRRDVKTLRRWIKSKKLRCEKPKGTRLWRLHREDVRQLGGDPTRNGPQ